MGFNTSVVVLNDALHEIANDPYFGKNLTEAIQGCFTPNRSKDVHSNGYCNAATVIACHHADVTSIIAVGGNYGTELCSEYNFGNHHTKEDQIKLLKKLADNLGFRIIEKRNKNE